MGMYDCRCMVTGVSLKGARAALVLLEGAGGGFRPASLAIFGNYNRQGCIDGIERDPHTVDLFSGFQAARSEGKIDLDEEYLDPITDMESLLAAVERTMNDNPQALLIDGVAPSFALISRAVWEALASYASGEVLDLDQSGIGRCLYRNCDPANTPSQALAAVSVFVEGKWSPADDIAQHYGSEMKAYLEEARLKFADVPTVLDGLESYAHEVAELLG